MGEQTVILRIVGAHNGTLQGQTREFTFAHAQRILRMQDARPLPPDYELADERYVISENAKTIDLVPALKKTAAKKDALSSGADNKDTH